MVSYVTEEEDLWEKADRCVGRLAKPALCAILVLLLLNADTVYRTVRTAFP